MTYNSKKSNRNFYTEKGCCDIEGHIDFVLKVAVNSKGEIFKSSCPICKNIIEQQLNNKEKSDAIRAIKKECAISGHGEYFEYQFDISSGDIIVSKCPKCEIEVENREPIKKKCEVNLDHGEYWSEYKFKTRDIVRREKGFVRTQCPKCEKERREEKEKAAYLKRQQQKRELFIQANIPNFFQRCSVDNYDAEIEDQKHALFTTKSYIEEFRRNGKGLYSLIYYGNSGNGKTHLAIAIMNAIIEMGFSATYASVQKVLGDVESANKFGSTEEDVHVNYAKFDLLVLDEIGVAQKRTESERDILYHLINSRYEKQLPTIIITNGPEKYPKDVDPNRAIDKFLVKYLSRRVLDRIVENGCEYMYFNWNSYRQKHAE